MQVRSHHIRMWSSFFLSSSGSRYMIFYINSPINVSVNCLRKQTLQNQYEKFDFDIFQLFNKSLESAKKTFTSLCDRYFHHWLRSENKFSRKDLAGRQKCTEFMEIFCSWFQMTILRKLCNESYRTCD